MAKCKGLVQFMGTHQGTTFTIFRGQNIARKKSSLDKARFMTDPAFAGSRAASDAFGNAAAMAGLIRTIFQPYVDDLGNGTSQRRLTEIMTAALRWPNATPDEEPPRIGTIFLPREEQAKRRATKPKAPPAVHPSELTPAHWARALTGFSFHSTQSLHAWLPAAPHITVEGNVLTLQFVPPSFPRHLLKAASPTHYQIVALLQPLQSLHPDIPLAPEAFSDLLPLAHKAPITLRLPVPRTSTGALTHPLLLALGVQTAQVHPNNHVYLLETIRALDIIHVATTPLKP